MLPIVDFETEPHVLYHVSPKSFDFPCREKINEAREWSQWHGNGVLGLWASTFPNMCQCFGAQVYRVTMKDTARRIGIPFSSFYKVTRDMEDFGDLIEFMCSAGDVAYIIDGRRAVGEVIVLNFDEIETFDNVTGSDLRDITVPLRVEDPYALRY